MAGKEVSGVGARGLRDLQTREFHHRAHGKKHAPGLAFARGLAETLGFAHIAQLTCAEHDKMIGYVSQLTHAIAVSLMNANDNTHLAEYTGDSFRDLTRIAKINENLWSELIFS